MNQGDTIVVSMDGKLDFETQAPLRDDLDKLMNQSRTDSVPKKIIFNLEKLEFVGSSGISSFVQALKNFNSNVPIKPRYCNVGNEFKHMLKAFDEGEPFEIYDTEDRAKK